MRFLSVCSGIEAASVAWEPLGWKAVGFSEIEPFPCAVLAHRFPNTPNYGSLTEHASWPIEPGSVDLLVGGTPCQSFSVAGLRKGMADPRGNLALVFLGLADRVKPRWIVWENVPGVLSSNGGRDFGSFLGALEQLGYGWAYRVLDAQHVGRCRMHAQGSGWDAVPQRRRRVFVVACLGAGGWESAAKVLFEPESLSGDTAKGRKKGQGVASDAQGGAGASGILWSASDQPNAERYIDKAGTLNCNQGQRGGYICPTTPFPAGLQPMSHWDGGPHPTLNQSAKGSGGVGSSNQELFSQGGAYLVPGVIPIHDQATRFAGKRGDNQDGKGNGLGIGQPGDPMNTLTRGDHHAVAVPLDAVGVPFRKSKRAASTTDDESWVEAGEANTLNNFDLGDTRTTHAVVNNVAPTVTSSGPPYSRTGNERVEAEALAVTTIYENSRRDALRIYEGTSPTLQSFMGTGGCNVPMVQPAMAVRRLTPTECMRLQGFPDDWARIPWKGKPADQCPDGPQYKAAGNSMAVPVMRWIGSRISAVEQLSTQPTK